MKKSSEYMGIGFACITVLAAIKNWDAFSNFIGECLGSVEPWIGITVLIVAFIWFIKKMIS